MAPQIALVHLFDKRNTLRNLVPLKLKIRGFFSPFSDFVYNSLKISVIFPKIYLLNNRFMDQGRQPLAYSWNQGFA